MCVGELLSAFLWRFRHVGPRVHPRGRIARRRDPGGTGESPFQKCLHLAARIGCVFATDNHADMHVVKCVGLGFVKTHCALAGFWVGKCRWNHRCRGCSKDFSTHREVLQQIIVDGQTTARRRQMKYFTVCLARRLWKICYIPLATFSSCGITWGRGWGLSFSSSHRHRRWGDRLAYAVLVAMVTWPSESAKMYVTTFRCGHVFAQASQQNDNWKWGICGSIFTSSPLSTRCDAADYCP